MNRRLNLRISIGAIVGSLFLGGATYTLICTNKERTVIPFYKETIKKYAVNTKLLSTTFPIEEDEIIETEEKEYLTKMQLSKINSIEVNAYSATMEEKNGNKIFRKDTHQYQFDYEALTEEEKNEKIRLFENGKLEEVCEGYTTSDVYSEVPLIRPEENKKGIYQADMVVHNVDYEDIQVEKQTKKDDLYESFLLTMAPLMGGVFGWMVENDYKMNKEMNQKPYKSKKKTLR